VGESFGQKPDDRLRVSILNEDEGLPPHPLLSKGWFGRRFVPFPGRPWSEVVIDDLNQSAGIRVELITSRDEAKNLVRRGKRSAILVFKPDFSRRINNCWFVDDAYLKRMLKPPPTEPGINPFYRDGVSLQALNVEMLEDPKQVLAASIMRQV